MTDVDPFVFVAAVRYAIRRHQTHASELVAREVVEHADLIRSDPRALRAIVSDVEDLVCQQWVTEAFDGTRDTFAAHQHRWLRVREQLLDQGAAAAAAGAGMPAGAQL